MRTLGDVVVITTEQVMSSKSHSATLQSPLYVRLAEESEGYKEYHCNGTPVDCVKLGYQRVLERWPDLVVSGINHGSNAGSTVVYSATVGAVVEACMDGMTAIGFSLDCFDADADFDHLMLPFCQSRKSACRRSAERCLPKREFPEALRRTTERHKNMPSGNGEMG